jgi:hypothetical protein
VLKGRSDSTTDDVAQKEEPSGEHSDLRFRNTIQSIEMTFMVKKTLIYCLQYLRSIIVPVLGPSPHLVPTVVFM